MQFFGTLFKLLAPSKNLHRGATALASPASTPLNYELEISMR